MAKILVVDDSETLRNQLKELLSETNFEVLEAVNGLDGLEKVRSNSNIDLILCDVNMPELDGLSMCEHILDLNLSVQPKIFMLTTESSKDMKIRGKACGVMAWVTKPFVGEKLLSAIHKILN